MRARQATLLIVAVPVLALAAIAGCHLLTGLFGPPAVDSKEAYADDRATMRFDHSVFDAVLREHVGEGGLVDYAALERSPGKLDAYIRALAAAPFRELGRDGKLALLINGYNAFTLRLILDHWPVASIKDIPASQRWQDVRWQLGPLKLSLDQIEHEYLRRRFAEPRIHFAINCASIGCPPLRREAYDAAKIERQLEEQARTVHRNERWFRLETDTVHLTRLYDWFRGDFEQAAGSVLRFAARFVPALKTRLDADNVPRIAWLHYDWSINARR